MLEVEGALDINAREIFGHAYFYQNPAHLGVLAMLLEYIGTIFYVAAIKKRTVSEVEHDISYDEP